ncbi:MAG: hypothetical protein QOC68_2522 [Solirubrobacteraceae bacterium]|jgi:hypothetical protein|nr:hypothetical protein [Solirubrobacteraceae bacterium]
MTRPFLLFALFALLTPTTASAASFVYDVPDLVAKPLIAVNKATKLDVLLPSRMTTHLKRLYSAGSGRERSYDFEIGAVRNCHSATACFVASFRARAGAKPSNPSKVKLRGGRRGYFRPLSCGASCAAPSLEWVQDGVLYTIEAKLGTKRTERKILVRLANSAIAKGPR